MYSNWQFGNRGGFVNDYNAVHPSYALDSGPTRRARASLYPTAVFSAYQSTPINGLGAPLPRQYFGVVGVPSLTSLSG